MNFKTADMDMLHGPLIKKLLLFTLPIALGSMLQQLFNAADTAVVGYFENQDSLAAVGTNAEIVALIVTVSSGLSVGANILAAGLIGKNRKEEIPSAIRTSIVMSVIIGIFGMIFGQFAAKPLLRLIQAPEDILHDAALYLRIYMLGYPFLLLYDFGSAVLRARGDSRYPFLALVFSGVANVGLNLFFVIVFRMGVAGVAVATGISNMLSSLIVLYRLKKRKPDRYRLTQTAILPAEYGGNPENGDSVRRAGRGILLCQYFCAGIGQRLRRDGNRGEHCRHEF